MYKEIKIGLIILLIIIVLLSLYKLYIIKTDKFSVENNERLLGSDNEYYYVQSYYNNKQEAVELFVLIDSKIEQFINYLFNKYKDSYNGRKQDIAIKLRKRYNSNNLRETSPLNKSGDTSFVINKGKIIAICLRDKNSTFHKFNIIMFVVLHELTHLVIESFFHPPEFWEDFKFLLIEIEIAGIYFSENYKYNPVSYCGKLIVDYNPRFDDSIKVF